MKLKLVIGLLGLLTSSPPASSMQLTKKQQHLLMQKRQDQFFCLLACTSSAGCNLGTHAAILHWFINYEKPSKPCHIRKKRSVAHSNLTKHTGHCA